MRWQCWICWLLQLFFFLLSEEAVRLSDALMVATNSNLRRSTLSSLSSSYQSTVTRSSRRLVKATSDDLEGKSHADVIVIGSGLAGLSCAALLATAGYDVVVLEAHDTPGGCAHGWERLGYHFESGPSLYSGLSTQKSANPLKNIFQIIGEEPEWITYDRWGTVLPEGKFAAKIGPVEFEDVLMKYGGEGAVEDWNKLIQYMMAKDGLSQAAQATPSLALREDYKAIFTLAKYWKRLILTVSKGQELNQSFSKIRDTLGIKNTFVLNWLDMLCFLLQGLPAEGTLNAVIAYMLADWYRPNVTLDYPKGGSGAIVEALARGIRKNGGKLSLRKYVTKILLNENNEAVGVRYRDELSKIEFTLNSKVAVVSNIDAWNTRKLVPTGRNEKFDKFLHSLTDKTPKLNSFIHLHAGIDATGLPTEASADFPAQWAVVKDWNAPNGVEGERNVVLVSMPSLIDPTMAPNGKHVIHAYTPATEPYEKWANLDRKSKEYAEMKAEAASFLWDAVEQYIPDARLRSDKRVEQIGTPLTHERFLRRSYGTYGPRIVAGEQSLPGHRTPMSKLFMVGDFTFPGIGVPAAASSGAIAANTIMSLSQQLELLKRIDLPD